jgi:hypothetical protein
MVLNRRTPRSKSVPGVAAAGGRDLAELGVAAGLHHQHRGRATAQDVPEHCVGSLGHLRGRRRGGRGLLHRRAFAGQHGLDDETVARGEQHSVGGNEASGRELYDVAHHDLARRAGTHGTATAHAAGRGEPVAKRVQRA